MPLRPDRPREGRPETVRSPSQLPRPFRPRAYGVLADPGCRVARGAYAPPALTEPDLWAHIRLFGTPTFRTAPVVRCRCCHPQLSQIQCNLDRAGDGLVA